MSVKDAAIQGTSQVSGAITSSTLTTIIVFLPIVYLHGASGALFRDQAWTITLFLAFITGGCSFVNPDAVQLFL